jgi:hypothetical protein
MKTKAFLLLCLLIGIGMTQLSAKKSDNKGGMIVSDTYIVTLRSGVTMDQYVDFLKTEYVSEYDKNFPGSSLTIGSPDFWMKKNQYSFIFIFESDKEYYRYYPNGTKMSAECKAAWEKMKSVNQEESKYILDKERVETEWGKWMDEVIVK